MSTIHKSSGFRRFLSGKGFYVALAACVLVVGGVAVATFSDRLTPDKNTDPTPNQNVVEPMEGIKDNRTTVTTKPTTTAPTTAATTKATAASQNTAPLFVLPGSNEVIKPFSGNTPVYSVTMGDWRCHNGTDFGGNEGMTVKAISDGTVKSVETDAVFGETVVIDHGFGVQSRYCGVTSSVKKGDKVKAADAIGMLAGVPCEAADGCHLHLELTVNGAYADPVKTINKEVRYKK